jgi:hypothetical protein
MLVVGAKILLPIMHGKKKVMYETSKIDIDI